MTKINKSIRAQLYKVILWQLAMIIGFAFIVFALRGFQKGASTLVGSLAYWVPTCIFIWRVSAYAGARAAMQFMIAFIAGEFVKLFLSGLLFVLMVNYFAVDMFYGVIGLIAAIIAFWIASVTSVYQGVKA
jgi:ATP synthase protein I